MTKIYSLEFLLTKIEDYVAILEQMTQEERLNNGADKPYYADLADRVNRLANTGVRRVHKAKVVGWIKG